MVIAIIGMLAALLVPAVRKGLDSAKQSACLSNTHQISVGGVALTEEDEVLPLMSGSGYGPAVTNLLPYVKGTLEIFDCPVNRGLVQNGNHEIPATSPVRYTEYAINLYLFSTSSRTRRASLIDEPSRVAFAWDSPFDPDHSKGMVHGGAGKKKGGVNVGYLDGRSAFLTFDDPDFDIFFEEGHAFGGDGGPAPSPSY